MSKKLILIASGFTLTLSTWAEDSDLRGSRVLNAGKAAEKKFDQEQLTNFHADSVFKICGYPPALASFPDFSSQALFAQKLLRVKQFNECTKAKKIKSLEIKYEEFLVSSVKIESCKKELKDPFKDFFHGKYLENYNLERGKEKDLSGFSDESFTLYSKKQAQLCEDVKNGKYNKDIFKALSTQFTQCEKQMTSRHSDALGSLESTFKKVQRHILETSKGKLITDTQITNLSDAIKTCNDTLASLNAEKSYQGIQGKENIFRDYEPERPASTRRK